MAASPDTPRPSASRWTSFVADSDEDRPRILSEGPNPADRLRFEHRSGRLGVSVP